MRQHSENSSNKLMSSSHYSLSEGQTFLFSFKEISLKEGIYSDDIYSHKVDYSSQMFVASFRDSAFALKLTRLMNRRVNTCKGNEILIRPEIVDIANFSKEGSGSSRINTINGSNDLKFFEHHRLTKRGEDLCNLIQSFHKMKESRDFFWEDEFLSYTERSNRGLSSTDNVIVGDRELSATTGHLKGISNGFRFSSFNNSCGWEFFEEVEHGMGEDITDRFQFREGRLKDSLNLIFSGSNQMTEGFSFSGNISEVFGVLRDRELGDRVFVDKEELSNSKGIFFICLSFSQGELKEVGNKQRVYNHSTDIFRSKKGEEIDVITSSRLHGDNNCGEVITIGGDSLKQFREALRVHISRDREAQGTLRIKTCGREGIFRYINTNKKTKHSSTSITCFLDKAGVASQPILHDDKGSLTQPTYHGFGRQGTDSFEGSMTQVKWSSPAFPSLLYMGKTHLYKLYITNS